VDGIDRAERTVEMTMADDVMMRKRNAPVMRIHPRTRNDSAMTLLPDETNESGGVAESS